MRVPRIALFGALILASYAVALAATDPMQKLLPASGFQGWKTVADSYVYGSGEGLTEIYDGGYKEYLDAGVVEAAKQTYSKGKTFADVAVHKMKSGANAKAFYEKQVKLAGKQAKALPAPWTGFTWVSGGSAYGYMTCKDYYLAATLTSKDPAGAAALMQEAARKAGLRPSVPDKGRK